MALTHSSSGREHNERLEFLGDAVLGSLVAGELYGRYPSADEGTLTRARATLVNRRTLARIARSIDIPARLLLGGGEARNRGGERDSILAGALEALIGAIYLDAGYLTCKQAVLPWFIAEFSDVLDLEGQKDPKTRLQELMQARNQPLPRYQVIETAGTPHQPTFTVQCLVSDLVDPVIGTASSKKIAEQRAARAVLAQLESLP
ncbi:MAG: ribonuclease III [Gammaproteobacteria bacterium]|nr:ribonuclease III [Gammaproteobacteria bacterium]